VLSADFRSDYVLRTYSNTNVLQTSNIRELPYTEGTVCFMVQFWTSTVYGDPLFEVYLSCARDSDVPVKKEFDLRMFLMD
jgi:hypothetical protein